MRETLRNRSRWTMTMGLAFSVLWISGRPAIADDLERVVSDYTGLYRLESLDRWKELFLPSFTVASAREDGSILERTFEEFFEAQRRYLASGREIREVLENVSIEHRGRLASVWADFVLTDAGTSRRGKLVLLLIEGEGGFKIQSLMFSYEPER
jgi:hypothetical protein